jgi:hypothetical protein
MALLLTGHMITTDQCYCRWCGTRRGGGYGTPTASIPQLPVEYTERGTVATATSGDGRLPVLDGPWADGRRRQVVCEN